MSGFPAVLPVLACVAAFTVGHARAEGDGAAAPDGVNPKAVEYVLGKVRCSNPEDVVRAAFGGVCYDDPGSAYHYENVGVERRDIGDGTPCYIFEPPRAAGASRYLFVLEEGRLRPILGDCAAFILEHKPKVNGRHLIAFGDHTLSNDDHGQLLMNWESISFWDGREYVLAYTVVETTLISAAGAAGARTETTVKWNPGARARFLAAPRTWTYVVRQSDTLTRIAARFEATVGDIVEQNGIADPDSIRPGQELRFDSRKARSGPASVVGGVSCPEPAAGPDAHASAE